MLYDFLNGSNTSSVGLVNLNTNKFYTYQELEQLSNTYYIPITILTDLIEIQTKGVGTLVSNHAKTVFHRDIFKQLLTDNGLYGADTVDIYKDRPMQVNLETAETLWNKPTVNEVKQEQHFDNVLKLVFTENTGLDEESRRLITQCAYKACTIGLGQILGKEFEQCGYTDFDLFIEDMYTSEYLQLKALCEYITSKGLTGSDAMTISSTINQAVNGLPLIAGSLDTDVGYQADLLRSKL